MDFTIENIFLFVIECINVKNKMNEHPVQSKRKAGLNLTEIIFLIKKNINELRSTSEKNFGNEKS